MTDSITYKPEVTYSFISRSDTSLKSKTAEILTGLDGNVFFPLAKPFVDILRAAYDIWAPTVVSRNMVTTLTANLSAQKRPAVEDALRKLLPEVQYESKNDLAKLLTTKIPLARANEPSTTPIRPTSLILNVWGDPMKFYVTVPSQPKALTYSVRITSDPQGLVLVAEKSSNKVTVGFSNLPLNQKLYVSAQVINAKGESPWSIPMPFRLVSPDEIVPVWKKPKGV